MDFEKYASYSIEEYLEDEGFRQWVFQPTPESNRQWRTFFRLYPEQKSIAAQARLILLEMKDYFQPADLRNKPIDDAFVAELKKKVETEREVMEAKIHRRVFIRRLSIAASLLLLVGFFSWFWLSKADQDTQIITTGYGERQTLELPDGSIVALNANSELKMAKKWEKGADRVVWLKGEAHFTVTAQPATQAKFTVITNDLSLNVLGTVFNVHAREKGTRVTLEEGKVALKLKEPSKEQVSEQDSIVMAPGEQVEFFAKTGQLHKAEKVNVIAQSAWKDGILIFDGITLEQLGVVITETFGHPVEFRDSQIKNQTITGSIPAANDLDLLLETIEKAFEIKIVKKDSLLIFE
jgi:transmembrane sensor